MRRAKLIALALALAACGAQPNAPVRRDNVLVVVLDDLGPDGLSCYAGESARTPNIDALARRGVRFENAWAYPLCSPTRAAIQTGRLGFRTGIGTIVNMGKGYALPKAETVLPEMLDLGTDGLYAHAAFGKWHLGNVDVGGWRAPNEAGYGHFAGALLRGEDTYFRWPSIVNGQRTHVDGYLTEATVENALEWIETREEPWFCYLALHAPHAPLHRPPVHLASVSGPDPTPRELYRAMVEAADAMIGRLIDGLGDQRERTTILLLGDNGPLAKLLPSSSRPHGKGTLYEDGVRVPLIAAGPRVASPGATCAALVHVTDVFATVADVAGVDLARTLPDVELDSQSLVPYLEDPSRPSTRRYLYTEDFRPNGPPPHDTSSRAIRDARHKLILTPAGEELYDLESDPAERKNLLTTPTPETRKIRDRLVRALTAISP